MSESSLTKVTTHIADAQARSTGQFKNSPQFQGTIAVVVRQIQDIENTLFDILDAEILDNAEGPFLDNIGDLVVQEREGLDDDFYRILIAVKIVKNFSKGEPAAVVRATRLIFSTSSVHYMNLGGANIGLYVNGTLPDVPTSFLYESLTEVAAAGVKIAFISLAPDDVDEADMFAFAGLGVGKGFGSTTDPDVGGKLAGVI